MSSNSVPARTAGTASTASIALLESREVTVSAAIKVEKEKEEDKGDVGGRSSEGYDAEIDVLLPPTAPEYPPSAVTARIRPGLEPVGGLSLRTWVS